MLIISHFKVGSRSTTYFDNMWVHPEIFLGVFYDNLC